LRGYPMIAVEADDLGLAAAADKHGLPIRRNAIFVVRELPNVAPPDRSRRAGGWIATGMFDIGAIEQIIHNARAAQPLEITVRRKLVITNVDFFASLPRGAAGRFVEHELLRDPVERADQRLRIVGQRLEGNLPAANDFACVRRRIGPPVEKSPASFQIESLD